MGFLDTIGAGIGSVVNAQVSSVESEALTAAKAIAVWGFVVAFELGLVVYLLSKGAKT